MSPELAEFGVNKLYLLLSCQALNRRLALAGLGLAGHILLMHELNRSLILGIKGAFFGVMLFEAAGNIRGDASIKCFIVTLDYIEEPRHGEVFSGKICTCCAPSGLASAIFRLWNRKKMEYLFQTMI